MADPRRDIPSIDRLLATEPFARLLATEPRALVVQTLQQVQADLRAELANGAAAEPAADAQWYASRSADLLRRIRQPSLRAVINATGVVLHTNLGRAPLADAAVAAIERTARGYSNLEYDLDRGRRGSRYTHCAALITRLTGAEAALVVNNNAAALVLALNTLAHGRQVVISRGELVEIGGSFRVPDILERSGAVLREIGSTNRTHADDYALATNSETGAILKVHPSNFRVTGFTAGVPPEEIARIAAEHGTPFIHDLGSGLLLDSVSLGLPHEPTAADAVSQGADVVTMSGDKLLGGPQAGIIAGRADYIDRMRRNPLCRALRVDRMTLAALEATLALYLDPERAVAEIPVLRMLTATADDLAATAERLAAALRLAGVPATVVPGESAVGGGAFPTASLPTSLVRIDMPDRTAAAVENALRAADPPVIARIVDDRVVLDPRTLPPDALARLPAIVGQVLASSARHD
jgi:L-seryl-tRNA(Ser) seleniumtransferase